jgi:acyl-CoA thioester hydrolase
MLMHKNKTMIRVRYAETDQMGFVHHGNYAQYLEIGRLEWLRELGLSYKEMEEKGTMLPVYSLNLRFIKSAFYDDELTIETTIRNLPTARIEFYYEIFNPKGELITTADTTLIFVDMKSKRPIKCPQYILEKLTLG